MSSSQINDKLSQDVKATETKSVKSFPKTSEKTFKTRWYLQEAYPGKTDF